MRRVLTLVLAGLVVASPATVAVLVARYARNVPYWDQWSLAPLMAGIAHGNPPVARLLEQVNEHLIPVTLVVQGAVSAVTRWDVRYEAWLNVLAALATLAAIAGLVRRSMGTLAAPDAMGLLGVCSALVFSVAGGKNWTWGSLNATYFAGLAAATLAWLVAGWRPTAAATVRLGVVAALGAFAFGTGLVLPLLLPFALLASPTETIARRAPYALATAGWASILMALYFVGWHAPLGKAPMTMHWNRLPDYGRYALAYTGAFTGSTRTDQAFGIGLVVVAMLATAGGWIIVAGEPAARRALPAWCLLAAYTIANGGVTALGRLDQSPGTSLFERYRPTQTFAAIAAAGVVALALGDLRRRRPFAAAALLALALAVGIWLAAPLPQAMRDGESAMARLSRTLDAGAVCLADRQAMTDQCLKAICWDAGHARRMAALLEEARIGPFAK